MAGGERGRRARPRRGRRLARALTVAVVLVLLAGVGGVLLVLNPPHTEPEPADAVLVIAGASDGRHELAAELIHDGYSDTLVVSNPAGERDRRGYALCQGEGVPNGTETWCMDPEPVTTTGEAQVFNRLARQEGWGSALLVTSPTHHRRVALNFEQCTDLRTLVLHVDEYDRNELARQVVWEIGGFIKFWFTQPCRGG